METLVSPGPAVLNEKQLEKKIENYLFQLSPQLNRTIKVECIGNTVMLSGRVNSYYQRQLCLNTCQRVAGVVKIIDEIEVQKLAS